ncbi:hypothetical protein OTERR_00950 [Oryzomicrobium terrae]|uniref:DOMON-like domain-containing protein n=1 Tax=Oryzomicrobium terrae TaxID=1735038 RepID=A0A5C1E3T8_9RHOO|nr:DOMON-like domain-containing protein [Oryzomicrobium terrae]QEL63571.1 hypothetical protein OTERR_00950 [Oryzomicrobium terrae]
MITTPPPLSAALAAHPDFPAPAVTGIAVTAGPTRDGGLALDYRLQGDLAALRIASPATPLDPDRLWAHTCFEVFLARGDQPAYREYNFSPSGQWAAYAFADYRQRDGALALPAPTLAWHREADREAGVLALRATLPATALPQGEGPLRLALTTVVERADGPLSYWALAHPAGKPDFHHRDGFALAVPLALPDL